MKTRVLTLGFACLLIGGFSLVLVQAQQRGGAAQGPPRLGFRVAPAAYQQSCGTCHGTQGTVTDGKRAPSIADLQEYSAERVYEFLNKATSAPHGGNFSDLQKRQFAVSIHNTVIGELLFQSRPLQHLLDTVQIGGMRR